MIPDKITNTPELSKMITDLRKHNPRNGKIMSKEQVSLAMGKGRTWLSQIETGRLKKISSEDLIKVFEIILNLNHSEAQEKVTYYYESYEEQSVKFNQLLQQFCSAVNDKYLSCQTQHDQRNFMQFLSSLYFNFVENPTDFEYLFDDLDLSLLNQADRWDKRLIYEKISELKEELLYLNKENIIKSLSAESMVLSLVFNDEYDGKSDGIKDCQNGVALLYRLSDYYRRNPSSFDYSDLDSVNTFINTVQKYSNHYFPTIPFNISELTTASTKELDCMISDMRKHIQFMLHSF